MDRYLSGFVVWIVLLSGCILPGTSPLDLGDEHNPWTQTDAEPWLVLTRGCGMCIGSSDYVEANTLVIYEDGSVLWYAFGFTQNAVHENEVKVAEVSLEPWEEELQQVVPMLANWHTQNRTLHVHQIAVNRVQEDDWDRMAGQLRSFEERVQDPGPPRYSCEDCSAPTVELLGKDRLTTHLVRTDPVYPEYGNYRDEEPWDHLLTHLIQIAQWAETWKHRE